MGKARSKKRAAKRGYADTKHPEQAESKASTPGIEVEDRSQPEPATRESPAAEPLAGVTIRLGERVVALEEKVEGLLLKLAELETTLASNTRRIAQLEKNYELPGPETDDDQGDTEAPK